MLFFDVGVSSLTDTDGRCRDEMVQSARDHAEFRKLRELFLPPIAELTLQTSSSTYYSVRIVPLVLPLAFPSPLRLG